MLAHSEARSNQHGTRSFRGGALTELVAPGTLARDLGRGMGPYLLGASLGLYALQHRGQEAAGIVSFEMTGVHPHDIGTILDQEGVAIRAGHHCAMPLFKHLKLSGAIRVSLALYNDSADIERFFEALDHALEMLR